MSNTNSNTVAHRFAEVRDALFRWEDHDKPEYEFYVKNLYMVSRPNNVCVCAMVKSTNTADNNKAGFVLVRESWANMFPAHHVSCAVIPPDGIWTPAIHKRNEKRLLNYIKDAYTDTADSFEDRARYMLAIRRQIVMYTQIFPDSGIDTRPTQFEAVIVVDAKLAGEGSKYIESLGTFLEQEKSRGINEI